MNTRFEFANQSLQLQRYPASSQHPTLQAWGSEDEYVLNHLYDQQVSLGRTLIVNDEFGALGLGLQALMNEDSVWQSDSYIAHCALEENRQSNTIALNLEKVNSLYAHTGTYHSVVIRLPKNLQYLRDQLQQLAHCISPQTLVIATGKVKAVTRQVLDLFEQILGPTRTSLAVKKSRLIFCTPESAKLSDKPIAPLSVSWQLPATQTRKSLAISNLSNVFSSRGLDIGARFMLEKLPAFHDEDIIDLGCGNGVLGLAVLAQSKHCSVTFVDESYMAVESTRRNIANNFAGESPCDTPSETGDAHFYVDNCLDGIRKQDKRFDRVLCNPPFHQQNTLTDHIAWQMFNDAKAVLKKGGKLWVVGNRHLGYHDKLKRVFGGVKPVASNPKFVILEAIKR